MKSSAILSLALIFAKRFNSLDADYIQKLIEIILILIKEKNKETYKAVIAFFKFYVKRADLAQLQKQMRIIIGAVLTWDEASHDSTKNIVRTLLTTIYKKVGKEAMLDATPEQHHKLIRYIGKQQNRHANMRKKLNALKEGIETGEGKTDSNKSFLDMEFIEKQLEALAKKQQQENGGNMEEERKDQYKNLLLKFDALVSTDQGS